MTADHERDAGPGGPLFWTTGAVGMGTVVFALARLRAESSPTSFASATRFLLGAGIAHDALWAPAAVVVGVVTALLVPKAARLPVRLGLAFTALVLLVSWPEVRRYGARATNPSILPLDYDRGLAIVLSGIWILVAVAVAARAWPRRARS